MRLSSSIKKTIDTVKRIAGALIIIALLKFTGLLNDVSDLTQTAALKTGFLNASIVPDDKKADFIYDFKIKDLAGNRIDFNQYKGKVVFLNLWATWCGPCRAEMPTIQSLFNKINSDKIAFVLLSLDEDKNKEKVERYVKDRAFTFPVFMPSGHLPEQLQVPSIPTTFVIAKDGKILTKEVGTANYDTEKFKKFLETEASR